MYRFVSSKTYEAELVQRANRKLGLDQAILHIKNQIPSVFSSLNLFTQTTSKINNQLSEKDLDSLLKHGAYPLFEEEKQGLTEINSKKFIEADIDQILEENSHIVVYEDKESGSQFSKASFTTNHCDNINMDDPDFWKRYIDIKNIDYTNHNTEIKRGHRDISYRDNYIDTDEWLVKERDQLLYGLKIWGYGSWEKIQSLCDLSDRSLDDIERYSVQIILQLCRILYFQKEIKKEELYKINKEKNAKILSVCF